MKILLAIVLGIAVGMFSASYAWKERLLQAEVYYTSKAIDYQKQGIMYAMKSCETHGFAWVDRPETKEGLIMDCWQSRVKLLTGEAYDRAVEQNELFEKNARPLVPRPQVY